jgi:hypothetical protein
VTTIQGLSQNQAGALFRKADPFIKADKVGVMVGLVLIPVLFIAAGGALFFFIPMPFALYVGGAIWLAMVPLELFVFLYGRRTLTGSPLVMDGVIHEKSVRAMRNGDRARYLHIEVIAASSLGPQGMTDPVPKLVGKTEKRLVTTPDVFDGIDEGERAYVVCVPGGPVVAVFRSNELAGL